MNKNKIWRKWILNNRVPYVRTTYFILKFNIFYWNCPATKQKWRRIVQAVVEISKFVDVFERNFTIIIIYVCQWQICHIINSEIRRNQKERENQRKNMFGAGFLASLDQFAYEFNRKHIYLYKRTHYESDPFAILVLEEFWFSYWNEVELWTECVFVWRVEV